MDDKQKAQASRAFGSSYLIFDADGNEFETIRNRSQAEVLKIVDRINGEAWLSGRCVMRADVDA